MEVINELVVKTYDKVFRAVKYSDDTIEYIMEDVMVRELITKEMFYEAVSIHIKEFLE